MAEAKRLLIVDDDAVFCRILARGMGKYDFDVRTASDGEAALQQAREHLPAFCVLDLRLGEESGLQLVEPLLEIRPKMHIIVLTGYASLATAVQAVKLGAINYLAKPVDAASVYRALGDSEVAAAEVPPPEEPVSLKGLEWEHIQRVLEENDGNISATARQLGMHRRTLQRKLQKRPQKS